ncbi:DsbA family protein [Paenibacillus sp. HW567]|uniref:DsbA family protein n=1 Tax=Paenibacillus sp. HW567 TaxID=1034769 RepID=UPI0003706A46|nr:DsbA family protein [Paenibacillus sp. HW567]
MNQNNLNLIYVWDAYCGWCYGFSKTLRAFRETHPELPLTVLSGGLFTGERKQPISAYPHIAEANNRISQLTGAEFGAGYQRLLANDDFILDSEAAATGFAALRFFAPERAVYLASAMQHAFYFEGKSLSDTETYRELAVAFDLDPEAVTARMKTSSAAEEAAKDFITARQIGVQSYPTLLLQKDGEYIRLGGGTMTPEKLELQLSAIIA